MHIFERSELYLQARAVIAELYEKAGLAAGMKVIGINRNLAIPQDFTGCLLTVTDLSELRP